MSRLPALTARQLVAALKRAGFVEHRHTGGHLHLWHPQKELLTTVSIHPGTVPRGTVRAIIRQAGLTPRQFIDLL
jgi:predicted RNA binding protein YcfA (HicA-like mRNA interferase family)